MQQHDLKDGLAALDQNETRKLRFEARKFALETLVKMHLVQSEATRNLRVGHVKLAFALSLGALAGFLTLISAFARFIADFPTWPADKWGILLLGAGLGCLMVAAIAAVLQYHATVDRSADLLLRPYPKAEVEFQMILSDPSLDEIAYLDKLSTILRTRNEDKRQHQPPSALVLVLVLVGATVTAISLFVL